MPEYAWAVLYGMSWNVSLMVVVGFSVWYTHSPWCLLALLLFSRVKYTNDSKGGGGDE